MVPWHSRAAAFEVLFVCTGNICRSPLAERLLRARLRAGTPITAVSAGTHGVTGHAMDLASALALRELGGEPDGHVARRITLEMIKAADLILTMETAHRSAVLQVDASALRKTFTLREFARLGAEAPAPRAGVEAVTPEQMRARVAEVAAQRGLAQPVPAGEDEIGDPFGAALAVARFHAAQVSAAIDDTLAALGARSGASTEETGK